MNCVPYFNLKGNKMVISKVTNWDFINVFKNADRAGNFSIESLNALYDYINCSYDDSGPYTLDVIALCCSYTEYTHEDYIREFITPDIIIDLGYGYDAVYELIECRLENNIVSELWEHLDHHGIITDSYVIVSK